MQQTVLFFFQMYFRSKCKLALSGFYLFIYFFIKKKNSFNTKTAFFPLCNFVLRCVGTHFTNVENCYKLHVSVVPVWCLFFFYLLPENKHLLPADRKPGEEPESLVGKQVEYVTDNGLKRTGLVIYQVPAKPTVYYIKYDDDVHIHVYDLVKTT